MFLDPHVNGDDFADNNVRELRPCAAVDQAGRQMKQQIDQPRAVIAAQEASV